MYHSIFKETLFFFIFFIFKMRTFTIYDLKKKINIYFNNLITDTSSYLNCKYKMFQILESTHEKKIFIYSNYVITPLSFINTLISTNTNVVQFNN